MAPDEPLLAIDAGNTRIKWGVERAARWSGLGAIPTGEAPALRAAWSALPRLAHAVACNVAGEEVARALREACEARGAALRLVRAEPAGLGVTNGYRDPAQLGADRWAALVAAYRLAARHQLVVNAGTALTVDALEASGRFLGGLIVPGPALMRRSLDRGTAGLRLTEGGFDDFPRSTPDAITSGALQACAGAIERMADAMAARGTPAAIAIVSGGAAEQIAPRLPMPFAIRENLVLEGLALIARNA